jgi:hypothetical protein
MLRRVAWKRTWEQFSVEVCWNSQPSTSSACQLPSAFVELSLKFLQHLPSVCLVPSDCGPVKLRLTEQTADSKVTLGILVGNQQFIQSTWDAREHRLTERLLGRMYYIYRVMISPIDTQWCMLHECAHCRTSDCQPVSGCNLPPPNSCFKLLVSFPTDKHHKSFSMRY